MGKVFGKSRSSYIGNGSTRNCVTLTAAHAPLPIHSTVQPPARDVVSNSAAYTPVDTFVMDPAPRYVHVTTAAEPALYFIVTPVGSTGVVEGGTVNVAVLVIAVPAYIVAGRAIFLLYVFAVVASGAVKTVTAECAYIATDAESALNIVDAEFAYITTLALFA